MEDEFRELLNWYKDVGGVGVVIFYDFYMEDKDEMNFCVILYM